jgi:hypothetical protein
MLLWDRHLTVPLDLGEVFSDRQECLSYGNPDRSQTDPLPTISSYV